MTTTQTAPATWTLLGITAERGECEHCGRSLARLFRVQSPEGERLVVGRTCSKNLTGYDWKVAQAERIERIRQAEERAIATYGDLYRQLVAQARREAEISRSTAGAAGSGFIALRDGIGYGDDPRPFAEECLAASIARIGRAA